MKRVALVFGPLFLTIAVSAIAFIAGAEEEAILRAIVLGSLTLLVSGGGTYLYLYARQQRELDLPSGELGDDEVVWAKSTGSVVHFRSGKPWKFWETVGGRLFLTNEVLEFRANPLEVRPYRILIALREVRWAKPVALFGIVKGALRIERMDGTHELFTFGAAFDVSREWASAIENFRDDLPYEDEPPK